MYELKKLRNNTYYIDCPSRVGVVVLEGGRVLLVDACSDRDGGKRILRATDSEGWQVDRVLVTHSHADHIGGLAHIVDRTGATAYAKGIEACFARYPILEPVYVWGGYPHKGIRNKFFLATGTEVSDLGELKLPEGYEILDLYGHSFDQVGLMTPDGTAFIADALASEETLQKYGVTFLFDVGGYLETLERMKELKADTFLASHSEPTDDILPLIERNIEKTMEVCHIITDICVEPSAFDTVLKRVFDRYGRTLNEGQYSIVGASVHAYLTYLRDKGVITPMIEDNFMLWRRI